MTGEKEEKFESVSEEIDIVRVPDDIVRVLAEIQVKILEKSPLTSAQGLSGDVLTTGETENGGESPKALRFTSCYSSDEPDPIDFSVAGVVSRGRSADAFRVRKPSEGCTNIGHSHGVRSASANGRRSSSTDDQNLASLSYMTPPQSPAFVSSVDSPRGRFANEKFSTPTYAKVYPATKTSFCLQFRRSTIGNDPFMSPLLAGDDLLSRMCPVYLVVCPLTFLTVDLFA